MPGTVQEDAMSEDMPQQAEVIRVKETTGRNAMDAHFIVHRVDLRIAIMRLNIPPGAWRLVPPGIHHPCFVDFTHDGEEVRFIRMVQLTSYHLGIASPPSWTRLVTEMDKGRRMIKAMVTPYITSIQTDIE